MHALGTRQLKHKQIILHTQRNLFKYSAWTQWREAKSGRPKLWTAQM